jgi:hypothetical protein
MVDDDRGLTREMTHPGQPGGQERAPTTLVMNVLIVPGGGPVVCSATIVTAECCFHY